jgi:hypothetical protein
VLKDMDSFFPFWVVDGIMVGSPGKKRKNTFFKEMGFVFPYHSSSLSSLPKNHGTIKNQKINHLSISFSC